MFILLASIAWLDRGVINCIRFDSKALSILFTYYYEELLHRNILNQHARWFVYPKLAYVYLDNPLYTPATNFH